MELVPKHNKLLATPLSYPRENAVATLFSLSVVDVYKVTIGTSGAIPPLVTLLSEGMSTSGWRGQPGHQN